jgi:hypothetical protein
MPLVVRDLADVRMGLQGNLLSTPTALRWRWHADPSASKWPVLPRARSSQANGASASILARWSTASVTRPGAISWTWRPVREASSSIKSR